MMSARKHGHQPAQRLGWPHLPTTNRKVQPLTLDHASNDGNSDERHGARVRTWIVRSMSGSGTEVCEEMRKSRMDVCCLEEVRWRGQGARFMG